MKLIRIPEGMPDFRAGLQIIEVTAEETYSGIPPGCTVSGDIVPVVIPPKGGMTTGYLLPTLRVGRGQTPEGGVPPLRIEQSIFAQGELLPTSFFHHE